MMKVLQVQHLQKVFFPGTENERHVLKNINLQVDEGDFIAVIGNNGAGKSGLLNRIEVLLDNNGKNNFNEYHKEQWQECES